MFRCSRKLGFCFLFLSFFLFICFRLPQAQASIFGTVRGIVHDVQHRPIPGARVELRAAQSDWKRSTITDGEGSFQMDAIPAGNYILLISHDGFRDFEQEVSVAADTAPLRHFPLEIASVTQKVEVHAEADRVDPTSSTSSATITRAEIAELPGASRTNSLEFITSYTPGAYMVHDQLHIRGGHQVSWLVDGVPVPNTNIAMWSKFSAAATPPSTATAPMARSTSFRVPDSSVTAKRNSSQLTAAITRQIASSASVITANASPGTPVSAALAPTSA